MFLTWTLSWGSHALRTAPLSVFDANIFYPRSGMLALSDPMLSIAPLFGFINWIVGNRIAALNLVMLILFIVSLVSAHALGMRIFGRNDAAIVVAVVASCNSYVFGQQNHPQLQVLGLIPLAFLMLLKAIESGRRRDGVWLALATIALSLANPAYGLIWVLSALVVLLVLAMRRALPPLRSLLRPGVPAVAIAAGVLGPVAYIFRSVANDNDFSRGYEPNNSLRIGDLLTPQASNWSWGNALDGVNSAGFPGEHAYFPGFLALALGAFGFILLMKSLRATTDVNPTSTRVTKIDELLAIVAAAGVALVLAIGPSPGGFPAPFRFFHSFVPGFDGIRVTSRFAVIAFLAGALLVGLGVGWLRDRLTGVGRMLVVPLVILVVVIEVGGPMGRVEVPGGDRRLVYEALDDLGDGAVVELPVHVLEEGVVWAFVEAPRMYLATIDFHPRFNGYSGTAPTGYREAASILNTYPSAPALELITQLDIRFVILHTGEEQGYPALDPASAAEVAADAASAGAVVSRHGADWLIDMG